MVVPFIFEIVMEEFLRPFFAIPIDKAQGFTIPYVGMSIANTPQGRLEDDESKNDGQSREKNLL